MILTEGADGVGKTTLCESLAAEFGYDYLHFGKPDSHPIDYWFREGLKDVKGGTVIDRLHLSEEAYGAVYRNGSQLTDHQFWLLEGWLWARNTMIVLCSTSWDNMRVNQEKVKGEYHDNLQHDIVSMFSQLMLRTSLPLCIYDYTVHDGKLPEVASFTDCMSGVNVTHTLKTQLEKRDQNVDFDDMDGIGCVQPKVWLVGDQPNPNRDAPTPTSPLFQVAFQSTSGEYLHRALKTVVYTWDMMHLSNARDVEGEDVYDLDGKWHQLGQPKVVALGNNAADTLGRAMVPYRKVPHPQWWRRFQNSQVKEYGDAIANATRI